MACCGSVLIRRKRETQVELVGWLAAIAARVAAQAVDMRKFSRPGSWLEALRNTSGSVVAARKQDCPVGPDMAPILRDINSQDMGLLLASMGQTGP